MYSFFPRFSVCHSAAGAPVAGKLDLETDAYAALVGVESTNTQAKDEGKLRVKAGSPSESLLWVKLNLALDIVPVAEPELVA